MVQWVRALVTQARETKFNSPHTYKKSDTTTHMSTTPELGEKVRVNTEDSLWLASSCTA